MIFTKKHVKEITNMKKWTTPEVSELNISATAQGKQIQPSFDEIRVDQNGNYWASFASGADSNPEVSGEVEVM